MGIKRVVFFFFIVAELLAASPKSFNPSNSIRFDSDRLTVKSNITLTKPNANYIRVLCSSYWPMCIPHIHHRHH